MITKEQLRDALKEKLKKFNVADGEGGQKEVRFGTPNEAIPFREILLKELQINKTTVNRGALGYAITLTEDEVKKLIDKLRVEQSTTESESHKETISSSEETSVESNKKNENDENIANDTSNSISTSSNTTSTKNFTVEQLSSSSDSSSSPELISLFIKNPIYSNLFKNLIKGKFRILTQVEVQTDDKQAIITIPNSKARKNFLAVIANTNITYTPNDNNITVAKNQLTTIEFALRGYKALNINSNEKSEVDNNITDDQIKEFRNLIKILGISLQKEIFITNYTTGTEIAFSFSPRKTRLVEQLTNQLKGRNIYISQVSEQPLKYGFTLAAGGGNQVQDLIEALSNLVEDKINNTFKLENAPETEGIYVDSITLTAGNSQPTPYIRIFNLASHPIIINYLVENGIINQDKILEDDPALNTYTLLSTDEAQKLWKGLEEKSNKEISVSSAEPPSNANLGVTSEKIKKLRELLFDKLHIFIPLPDVRILGISENIEIGFKTKSDSSSFFYALNEVVPELAKHVNKPTETVEKAIISGETKTVSYYSVNLTTEKNIDEWINTLERKKINEENQNHINQVNSIFSNLRGVDINVKETEFLIGPTSPLMKICFNDNQSYANAVAYIKGIDGIDENISEWDERNELFLDEEEVTSLINYAFKDKEELPNDNTYDEFADTEVSQTSDNNLVISNKLINQFRELIYQKSGVFIPKNLININRQENIIKIHFEDIEERETFLSALAKIDEPLSSSIKQLPAEKIRGSMYYPAELDNADIITWTDTLSNPMIVNHPKIAAYSQNTLNLIKKALNIQPTLVKIEVGENELKVNISFSDSGSGNRFATYANQNSIKIARNNDNTQISMSYNEAARLITALSDLQNNPSAHVVEINPEEIAKDIKKTLQRFLGKEAAVIEVNAVAKNTVKGDIPEIQISFPINFHLKDTFLEHTRKANIEFDESNIVGSTIIAFTHQQAFALYTALNKELNIKARSAESSVSSSSVPFADEEAADSQKEEEEVEIISSEEQEATSTLTHPSDQQLTPEELFLTEDNQRTIRETLNSLPTTRNWTLIDEKRYDEEEILYLSVKDEDQNEKFRIYEEKMTTHDPEVETFKAMLAIFKKVHPDHYPDITAPTAATAAKWKQACRKVGYTEKEYNTFVHSPAFNSRDRFFKQSSSQASHNKNNHQQSKHRAHHRAS